MYRGQFGILICRGLQNSALFTKRCKETYSDNRDLIICLTDEDIIKMLEAIKSEEYGKIQVILETKKRDVMI